jgi:hypothetical protein
MLQMTTQPHEINRSKPSYEFTVDLAVIESLGINLYSNAAAVVAEMVANAWDAEANEVAIEWNSDNDTIIVEDDGIGMTRDELNNHFLRVAYKKREDAGTSSPELKRPYMGRKGIGKLSVFSLANEITVSSSKEGEKNSFRIKLKDLTEKIKIHQPYYPEVVTPPDDLGEHGTRIALTNLRSKRASISVKALRRRLARRFDTLRLQMDIKEVQAAQLQEASEELKEKSKHRFNISINGTPVTYNDREDLQRLEYVWKLGDYEITQDKTPKVKKSWTLDDVIVDSSRDWRLEGWFGTVSKPDDLNDQDDENESLRNIIILARNRPIQEGILDKLNFNRIFGNYVTGQIVAEFLDLDDGSSDIATSDRQRLIEDDERVVKLTRKLRDLFMKASDQWSEQRPKDQLKKATERYPEVSEWVESQPADRRNAARKLMKTIAGLHLDSEKTDQRISLYKAGILAFERIGVDNAINDLDRLSTGLRAEELLPLLAHTRSYEDALYLQILRSRLEAIESLEKLIDDNEKEKVLQNHLFNNMWLFDPSWERATADTDMEASLRRIRKDSGLFDVNDETYREQGRIDIKYRTTAGIHMIIELKRYRRVVTLDELYEQGAKYYEALEEVLEKSNAPSQLINVVFILGQRPRVEGRGRIKNDIDFIEHHLDPINGRVLYYDEMLHTAQKLYDDYRQQQDNTSTIDSIIAALDARKE